jgi:hypothetical protein
VKKTKSLERLLHWTGLGLLLTLPLVTLADADGGLSESLRQALEAQGWQPEQAEDGSVIYRQPSTSNQHEPVQPAMQTLRGKALQDNLHERGWQLQWNPGGSLILRPQGQVGKTLEQAKPAAVGEPLDRLPDQPGFEYWRIKKQADGSWTFQPLTQAPTASDSTSGTTTLGRCEGIEVKHAAVSLPVDTWGEAQTLAQAWLHDAGMQGLLLGKIRRVLGIYLISLVEDSTPHSLKHQLAIRASDGRVILLE